MLPRTALSSRDRERYSRLHQLLQEPGLIRGNLVEMHRRCGKRTCRCQSDSAARHTSLYLGLSLNGKRHMVYIPVEWETRVRDWTARHAKVRDLLEQLSLAFLDRLVKRKR